MKIELTNLTFDNYEQVLKLKPSKEQEEYVESWEYILALAYIGTCQELDGNLWIIYADGEPVGRVFEGFIEVGTQEPKEVIKYKYANRIMGFFIDEKYQNQGIGKVALGMVINKICEDENRKNYPITLEVIGTNEVAKKLYEQLGFYDSGVRYDNDYAYVRLPQQDNN